MVSFNLVSQAHAWFMELLGICTFCLELRLLFALRYMRMIKTLAVTMFKSKWNMVSVGMVFLPLLIAFTSLYYLMFGSTLGDYRSFMKSASNLTVFTIDYRGHNKNFKNNGDAFIDASSVLYALLVTLIVFNLFVSILNEFLMAIRRDKETFVDNEVIDYMIGLLHNILPGKSGNICYVAIGLSERKICEND